MLFYYYDYYYSIYVNNNNTNNLYILSSAFLKLNTLYNQTKSNNEYIYV